MLTHAQVQCYAAESGLRDVMVAEKEIVLTFLLQLMAERGILEHLAFKDGTCLRKMFAGSQECFSTDLDFTSIQRHGHRGFDSRHDGRIQEPFCGIRLAFHSNLTYWNINDMVFHMKTTLNIDETVMGRLREEAARRGTTMSALVEAGLRHILENRADSRSAVKARKPLPVWKSGGFRVDVANREELYRVLDEK